MNDGRHRDESERIAALRAYHAMDTPPEACFDRLTRAAAHVLETPLAFLTLIDEERALLKSCYGAEPTEVSRDRTFCTHIAKSGRPLIVPDATLDPRFQKNPFVVGSPGIRFYAGAPLLTPAGFCIGAICGVDVAPRVGLSQNQLEVLSDLAAEAIEQIEHRVAKRKLQQYAAALETRERELRNSEESFRGLSLSCPAGIFRAELDGSVTYVNPRSAAIWEMLPSEMLGFGWLERIHPDDKDELIETWRSANDLRQYYDHEYRLLMPDASVRWVHGRSAIITCEQGDTIVGTVDDITARQETLAAIEIAKAEAEEANRAKDLFLANVSHELRTPLNGILGMSELLLQANLDPKTRECAEVIQGSGKTLLTLVNDVLDTGKITAGTLTIEAVPFDIRSSIEMAANYVRQELDVKRLAFSVQVEAGVPAKLIGDGSRIQQIVVNFLTNAVKFTDSGGVRCRISGKGTGATHCDIRVEVQDSGQGIPLGLQAKLFQPFSQVDSSSTRKQRGVGLGLSICRRLAELMGGSVGVKSAEGSGSTFWLQVQLPIASDLPVPACQRSEPVTETNDESAERGRILVAEDNPINQRVVSRMLERLGWHVDIAPDGVKAFELAQQNRYALVFMDCLMPESDGYTTTAQIREYERSNGLPRLPIVALTANALSGDRERCLQVGMDDYLSKPLQLHLLREVLDRWQLHASGAETITRQ